MLNIILNIVEWQSSEVEAVYWNYLITRLLSTISANFQLST